MCGERTRERDRRPAYRALGRSRPGLRPLAGCPAASRRGDHPQAMASSSLTCADSIKLFDIADRSVSENRDRPPWLGRLC